MSQQLPYVTKEQAVRLKELGFDWPCDFFFLGDEPFKRRGQFNNSGIGESMPTIPLALMWARSKYLFGYVSKHKGDFYFVFMNQDDDNTFDTYEEAESALLDYVLEYLLKLKEEGK